MDLNLTTQQGSRGYVGVRPQGNFSRESPVYLQCFYYDIVNMIALNSLLFLLGVTGNVFIIMIMWREMKKFITSFLLVNLAVSDTLVLTTYWIFQSPKALAENFKIDSLRFLVKYFGYFLQKYQAVVSTFMLSSTWIIVLATFHR